MERGTGRTARLLAALPKDSAFVIPFRSMQPHCECLLQAAGREARDIRFVTIGDLDRLRGLPRTMTLGVDHAVFDFANAKERAELRQFMARFRVPDAVA